MISIRFYRGSFWNPLHLLIMAVTRSRVVHCEVTIPVFVLDRVIKMTVESTFNDGVRNVHIKSNGKCTQFYFNPPEFEPLELEELSGLIGTPYDYRAALSYIWPWVKQREDAVNCVELVLLIMRKAGIPTPRHLPTPGGLERWCRKLKKEMK